MVTRKPKKEKNTMTKVVTFFIPNDILSWIDDKVSTGEYFSRSHVIRTALKRMKEEKKNVRS